MADIKCQRGSRSKCTKMIHFLRQMDSNPENPGWVVKDASYLRVEWKVGSHAVGTQSVMWKCTIGMWAYVDVPWDAEGWNRWHVGAVK